MKIIDLLNKIANGEEVPKLIRYENEEYTITKILMEDNEYWYNYINDDMECLFPISAKILNNEVEILEEEKKIPKKLNLDKDELLKNVIITAQDYVIEGKINEIITYLESKGE